MAKDMYQKRKERKEQRVANDNTQEGFKKNVINWYPGHMAKTKRLITENLNLIDVVYEVLDARIPFSSKVKDLDNYIKTKPRIIILTKYDLCDKIETNKWIKHYQEQGYKVIALDLEHQPNLKPLLNLTKEVMEQINIKRENKGMKIRKTRALIVGIPNAGKSTLINRLVGKKAVNVGNKPGVTKQLNWIRINDQLELLDTPGILWPKIDEGNIAYNLATFTAIKEEIIPVEQVITYILNTLSQLYPNILLERYSFATFESVEEAINIIGRKRGCLIKGGVVDYEKVYTIIMNDIKVGAIKGVTFDRI